MILSLVVSDGPNKGTTYQLRGQTITIGRSADCDIPLQGVKGVSRKHARLTPKDGRVRIKDLGSSNGTLVEGEAVTEAILVPGVTIKIGAVSFLLQGEEPMPVAARDAKAPAKTAAADLAERSEGREAPSIRPMESEGARPSGANVTSMVLMVFLLGVIIAGGIYVMKLADVRWRPRTGFRNISVNEMKAVNFGADFERWEIRDEDNKDLQGLGRKIIHIEEYRGLLAPSLSKLAENSRAPRRKIVVVHGMTEGDTTVRLLSRGGSLIAKKVVTVRGIKPRQIRESLPEKQARDMAEKAVDEAKNLEHDGKLFEAIQKYRFARDLYRGPADDVDLSNQMRNNAKALQGKLQEQVRTAFNEAMELAFPANEVASPRDFDAAIAKLQEVKFLINDSESLDFQVVKHWEIIIQKLRDREK